MCIAFSSQRPPFTITNIMITGALRGIARPEKESQACLRQSTMGTVDLQSSGDNIMLDLNPSPTCGIDPEFERTVEGAVGEPKPTVGRVLTLHEMELGRGLRRADADR